MDELPARTVPNAANLFSAMQHHLAIRAVLAGAAQGRLFADDDRHPGAAILWVQHRVFLSGAPEDAATTAAVRELLANVIAPAARARGDYAFGFYYAPPWHDHLAELLPHLPHTPIDRQYYVTDQTGLITSPFDRLPAGMRLAAVDASLLAQTELANYARLAEELCSERPSVEDFLERSFGVCLLDGDRLVGWCLSEYNCAGRCEVGIEVIEEYQRRGLGTLLTQVFCAEAARRGIRQVGWHCLASNLPSGATARKAGLRLALEYPSAVVWLTAD